MSVNTFRTQKSLLSDLGPNNLSWLLTLDPNAIPKITIAFIFGSNDSILNYLIYSLTQRKKNIEITLVKVGQDVVLFFYDFHYLIIAPILFSELVL